MRIRIVAIGLVMLLCAATLMTAQNGYELFQQGLLKERGEGDVAGAIKIYEHIVRDFKSNRPLVAKTLVQLGACYEKLMGSQAQSYYDQVIRDYPEQKDMLAEARRRRASLATYASAEALRERRVWQDASFDGFASSVSADGGYLGLVDRSADGGLAIRDLRTGINRKLSRVDAETGGLVISRDGKQVAYSGRDRTQDAYELRVGTINASQDRLLLSNKEVRYQPKDWSPAGKILTLFSRSGGSQIAMVDASSGTVQTLKTFLGASEPGNLTLSPDGRFVAYDFPQDAQSHQRDVFVLDTAGALHEFELVRNPANDYVLGWTPDGKWLLFGSDRGNAYGVWAIETVEGKPAGMSPLRIKADVGEMRALGMTRTGSLMYSLIAKPTEVRALESILPELSRLQLAALQQGQTQAPSTASIEGVLVKAGTDEPVAEANVELMRLEGTSSAPLSPGAAESFPGTGGALTTPPASIAPELQYTKSDDKGRFVFRNLKPGGYHLVAAPTSSECPCTAVEYGQRSPRGRGILLPVGTGQTMKNLRLELAVAGVVTGRVSDVDGEPLGHATVIAAEIVYEEGRRMSRVEQIVLTDEQGDYRLRWLPPGRYLIAARIEEPERRAMNTWIGPPGRSGGAIQVGPPLILPRFLATGELIEEAYGLAYLGGITDPTQARELDVRAGSVIGGADISMSGARVRSHHVRGVLMNGVTGQPVAGVRVQAMPMQPSPSLMVPMALSGANGAFDLAGAIPGKYMVVSPFIAGSDSRPGTESIAYLNVEVGNADVDNLRLITQPPFELTGRMTIEGRSTAESASDLQKVKVLFRRDVNIAGMPRPAPQSVGQIAIFEDRLYRSGYGVAPSVDPTGRLRLKITPGDYRVLVNELPANTYVKSMTIGTKDVFSEGVHISGPVADPIEIVLGTGTTEVAGTSVGSKQEIFTNALVALVPDSLALRSRLDLYKNTSTDASGRFTFKEVPPGDYKLFAWDWVQFGSWMNSQFLQEYESSGKLIHVESGKKQETQVTVVPRR